MQHRNIAFIGAGNMAKAIISGLVNNGYPAQLITATSPSMKQDGPLHNQYGINCSNDNIASVRQADVVVLAVKPQMMAEVCEQIHQQVDLNGKLILSIAAGISVERFYQLLGKVDLIRIMPNTPSLIGLGMSGLYAPAQVSMPDRQFTEQLMQSVGEICWVEQESGINNIIAAAGSAPAYFFLFMESMQQEAERLGFTSEQARLLVQQTALGAAQMVVNNPQLDIATLRQQVTSKGGTTAEALRVFNENGLPEIVASAMQAASKRAVEMEKSL
ncbi:pyrroline-5-carboxylate reductase [Pragia fontium]|uniref:Pyrroline-5-carboxylate reductase n=2 Tax=Pragia fontium TaxID=82985 RepID=A0AAJ5BFZ4_9GAMM|nr:pyrroline-5-carboxylate reductase [Pragia fontium]AKJ41184.1 pyrroline-5-carboxylate reductase [Pragia fontium]SFC10854.1 pyrroline-5-carboxylate reductase [Pragia fontium DSM 5563 = ATCC 49100]SUB81394.1 Pyrroline-5-carboxylate reductase [Pragia fontium]VEJ53624.1 Pyrroline-5-carboxylate reductase [Pragia fontium]GKX63385.1 pyrroline-5-carboxylate reductase [Pragia fontium]